MHNHQPRNRAIPKLAIGALLLLIVIGGGYYAYWRYVAAQLTMGIERWTADQRAFGSQVEYSWSGIGGFPFAFQARFEQPKLHLRLVGAEVDWQGSDLMAEMSPWNLQEVRIASTGEHNLWLQALEQPGQWRLATIGFTGEIGFFGDGGLREIAAELAQPDAALPDGLAIAAGQAKLRLSLPEIPPVDYAMPFAGIALELSRLVLPAGTRLLTTDPVEYASIDATIMGPMAVPLVQALDQSMPQPAPPSLAQVLAAWRDSGGDVEVQSFNFAQGPLSLTGEATLALDGNLQPLGAGTVTAGGLSEAVEILLRDGLIPAERALVARATAKALERTGDDGKPQAKFALSLQNQTVSFGPAPLLQVPPIVWP